MENIDWTSEKLADLVEIVLGRTPSRSKDIYWGEGISWVSIADLKQKYINETKEQITEIGAINSRSRLVSKGTLMMSFKLSVGKLAFANRDLYTNEAIASFPIRDEKKIDKNYLYYILQNIPLVGGNQAVMGQTLNKTSLSNLKIPFPKSLTTQKRIAQVLSDCEELIAKRKESIVLLDELTKSTFLEMFGDPIRNSKNLETRKLSDLSSIMRGRFTPRPRNDPKYFGGNYPFIQTGDITRAGDYLIHYNQTLNELGTTVSKRFEKGTVVIALVGATIGETAILGIDAYATDSVVGMNIFSELITPRFLEITLKFWKPVLRSMAPEAARANINNETLKPLPIIIPAKKDLELFTNIFENIEKTKELYQFHLFELENLYARLSQDVFKGDLDFRKVVLREEFIERDKNDDEIEAVEKHKNESMDEKKVKPHITEMSLDDFYNIPDEIVKEYGSIENVLEDKEFLLRKYFFEKPIDLEWFKRFYNRMNYEKGNTFIYDEWKDFILAELKKENSFLKQDFNLELGEVQVWIRDEIN